MVTLLGASDVSGVSGDDERESMVAAVVVDIGDEGEHKRRAQRQTSRREKAILRRTPATQGRCLHNIFASFVPVSPIPSVDRDRPHHEARRRETAHKGRPRR